MENNLNKYPKGWSRKRVESVISHYDEQSEDEAIAEADLQALRDAKSQERDAPTSTLEEVRQRLDSRKRGSS